jgi:hypothetical protein
MKQEDKDLLVKDLCSRLPYGVWIERKIKSCKLAAKCMLNAYDIYSIERGLYDFYKPYLFPMSSMTEEQGKIYHELIGGMFGTSALINFEVLEDFFHKNHLDYRGLIPKGLANDATGLNLY